VPFDGSVLLERAEDQVLARFSSDASGGFGEAVHLFHVGLAVIACIDTHKHAYSSADQDMGL
jgi:hypothetical protein